MANDPRWRKSTRSNGSGECVEAGNGASAVLVRDTKQAHLPDGDRTVVQFSRSAWNAFTGKVK